MSTDTNIIIGELQLNIKFEYDKKHDTLLIKTINPSVIQTHNPNIEFSEEHILSGTEMRYGILTFGAKSLFGQELEKGQSVEVEFRNKIYCVKTHNKIKARIDGLTGMMKEFCDELKEGVKIKATYIPSQRKIILKTIE